MKEKIDVIIFGGQSNMQGQTERLSSTAIVENAWEYHYLDDALVPLRNPVGENIRTDKTRGFTIHEGGDGKTWLREHVTGMSVSGNTNLVPEFCRAYITVTGRKVAAVHVAKGSTQISYWLPGTLGYEVILEKTQAAIQKLSFAYDIGRLFFVWLQGESDAIYRIKKDEYMESLVQLNAALKKDLGIASFGIIRVGRFTGDERDQEIIDAQEAVCENNGEFIMLTRLTSEIGNMPQYMNPKVAGHYSAAGLELLGKAAGEELGKRYLFPLS